MANWDLEESIRRIFRYWWLIAGLGLLGSAFGLFAQRWLPPAYESQASLSVSLDYSRLGELDDLENDHLLSMVGYLLKSTEVRDAVMAEAESQNLTIPGEWGDMFYQDREGFRWTLRVRAPDAQQATQVVNIWAQTSLSVFTTRFNHALQAEQLANRLDGLGRCLEQAVAVAPTEPVCGEMNLSDIRLEISQTGAALSQEKTAARGILTAMSVDWMERSDQPGSPVRPSRGLMALAGLGIGLIAGILLLETGMLQTKSGR